MPAAGSPLSIVAPINRARGSSIGRPRDRWSPAGWRHRLTACGGQQEQHWAGFSGRRRMGGRAWLRPVVSTLRSRSAAPRIFRGRNRRPRPSTGGSRGNVAPVPPCPGPGRGSHWYFPPAPRRGRGARRSGRHGRRAWLRDRRRRCDAAVPDDGGQRFRPLDVRLQHRRPDRRAPLARPGAVPVHHRRSPARQRRPHRPPDHPAGATPATAGRCCGSRSRRATRACTARRAAWPRACAATSCASRRPTTTWGWSSPISGRPATGSGSCAGPACATTAAGRSRSSCSTAC